MITRFPDNFEGKATGLDRQAALKPVLTGAVEPSMLEATERLAETLEQSVLRLRAAMDQQARNFAERLDSHVG